MLPQLNLTNHFQIRTHNTHTHTLKKKTKLHFPQFQSIRALIFTSHSSNSTEFTLKSNVTTSGLHVVECYMETVTVEENGRESATDILISKQIADPVVYKLARVEGDGRLVPATDDEVMEAEFLDGNSSVHHVLDTGETGVCTMDDDAFDEGFMSIDCEGLLNFDDPSTHGGRSDAVVDTTVDLAKLNPQFEEIPRLESTLVDGEIDQSVDIKQADLPIGSTESEASTSTMCASLQPDFSKLRGEICLDDLSVRELQATFKATFGRETSVKDKQWLKRRISMGLSNSCDVSATTFRIENNRVAKKGKREHYNNEDEIHNEDPLVGFGGRNARGRKAHNINKSAGQTIQLEDHFSGSSKSLKCDTSNLHIPSDDNQGAKRVRKPTKRYIEEASEPDSGESGGKLVSSVRSSGHGPRTRDRPIYNIQPVRKPLVTRQDSLGGSGVEIPYVSRIRRGRPRENYLALMEFQSCGMGMASELVKKSHDDHEFQSDNEIENHKVKVEPPTGWMQQPVLIKEEGENERYSEQSEDLNNESDEGLINSYADDSDDNISTVPTAKGGMRRKHHRPWTLSEVVKLVEGVSRHGAGRWSEIKRISFPTCAHRTAVDLKDKWRNLLRASFTQLPADKGVQNSKKQQSIPIPAPILLRVRELAKLQGHIIPHVRPDLRAVKFGGHNTSSSRHVNDIRSGFL